MFLCEDWLAVTESASESIDLAMPPVTQFLSVSVTESGGVSRRTLRPSNAVTAVNNSTALVRNNMFHHRNRKYYCAVSCVDFTRLFVRARSHKLRKLTDDRLMHMHTF